MGKISQDQVRELMAGVLSRQGKTLPDDDAAALDEIGFRSLDFSELALRVEDLVGDELNFEAAGLREIATVGDVLTLMDQIQP